MTLDPQCRQFLDELAELAPTPWQQLEIAQAKELFDLMTDRFGEGPELPVVRDDEIAGVPVRFYQPATTDVSNSLRPVIVYFHGGGWVLGSRDSHDTLCRQLTVGSGADVISVEYRRPPEHPFPAAIDDCIAVADAVLSDAVRSAAGQKVFVAGDSAGGNLAAAVCIHDRDQHSGRISGQVLIYPVIDHSLSTASYSEFADGFGLTKETMEWFWQQYLGTDAGKVGPLASPALCDDASRLPPALILIAGYDVLRDEGEHYAQRLRQAGVSTTQINYPGMLHGFTHFSAVFNEAAVSITDIGNWIRRESGRS